MDAGAQGPERDLGWSLGVLLRAYQAEVGAAIAEIPQGHRGFQVLAAVVHGERPSQLALASHLGIDRTVMTYLLDRLGEAGLVERRVDPADRRQRKVVATPRGAARLAELEQRVRAAEERLLRGLDPAERDAFRSLLQRVACAVHDVEPETDPCAVVTDVLAGRSAEASS